MDFISLASSLQSDTSFTFTATVIIAGLSVVLATLALLVIVFTGFGSIVSKTQKKKKKDDDDVGNFPAPAPKKQTVTPHNTVSGEIVAAISAAVYAIEGENAVITSIVPAKTVIKRTSPAKCRNPWAQAAVIDNNKAF